MTEKEASKKLEFYSKQICHGCVHPSMVGWCENHCQLPKAFKMAISALEKQTVDKCCETCKYKSHSAQEIPCCDCYMASCFEDCYEPYTEEES